MGGGQNQADSIPTIGGGNSQVDSIPTLGDGGGRRRMLGQPSQPAASSNTGGYVPSGQT